MKQTVIFDMDGTLWDAVDQIVASWNQVLDREDEKPIVTRENITGLMGQTMDRFAAYYFPQYTQERGMDLLQAMCEAENHYLETHGALLLGDVRDTFVALRDRGYDVCIVSNCQAGYIEAFLSYYGLEDLVTDLECYGNNGLKKAENLKLLIKRNEYEKYWYVGDTQGDLDACNEAEVPFIWAAYGFGKVSDMPTIQRLEDLKEYDFQ